MSKFQKLKLEQKRIVDELKLGWATMYDYNTLKKYHYINKSSPPYVDMFGLFHPDNPTRCLGIIVYAMPKIIIGARMETELSNYLECIPKMSDRVRWLNANLRYASRFILHPSVRGIGAIKLLFNESRKLLNVRWVETASRMAYYYDFHKDGAIFSKKIQRFNSIENMYSTDRKSKSSVSDRAEEAMIRYNYNLYRNEEIPVKTIREIMAAKHR